MNSVILTTAMRFLTPLILILSVFILLRGHNEPGGGFIGGLLAAVSFALIQKAQGVAEARRQLRFDPMSIAAVGLGCTLIAGLWGGLSYGAFLKGVWPLLEVAADGSKEGLPIGSILLFDIGVFLVVVGVVTAILFTLEEEVAGSPSAGVD